MDIYSTWGSPDAAGSPLVPLRGQPRAPGAEPRTWERCSETKTWAPDVPVAAGASLPLLPLGGHGQSRVTSVRVLLATERVAAAELPACPRLTQSNPASSVRTSPASSAWGAAVTRCGVPRSPSGGGLEHLAVCPLGICTSLELRLFRRWPSFRRRLST